MATTIVRTETESASQSATCDIRKYFIAAMFLWTVNTWIVATHSTTTSSHNNNAFLQLGEYVPPSSSSSSTNSFQLASDQSYGFFNDITDESWKRLQSYHAALFPNYYSDLMKYSNGPGDRGLYAQLRHSGMWYGQNFQVEFICPGARRLPADSMADGPKWICNPHRIAQQKDCLVYSFGSNGKAEFEKAVKEEIGDHCEIHTFDPTRSNKKYGDFETAVQPWSTFHHWGLGNRVGKLATDNSVKFKSLKETMEALGHTGRRIDIFKIDCEWCEWFYWQEWLSLDIGQLLVETHNAPMPQARDFFFNLHDAGFVIFSKEANYENGAGGVEYAFVKVAPEFFINNTQYFRQKGLKGAGPGYGG